jgi:hypothetical protein
VKSEELLVGNSMMSLYGGVGYIYRASGGWFAVLLGDSNDEETAWLAADEPFRTKKAAAKRLVEDHALRRIAASYLTSSKERRL